MSSWSNVSLIFYLDDLSISDSDRAFHHKTAAYTFFSSAYGAFLSIDHILGHRDSLNKYKRIEIMPTIFSDHNALKLEIRCKNKSVRTTNTWRSNNMILKNNCVREEGNRSRGAWI